MSSLDLDSVYLSADPIATAAERMRRAPTGQRFALTVLDGVLPEWVAESPALIAQTGLNRLRSEAQWLQALRQAGQANVTVVGRDAVDPMRYQEWINQDFLAAGVSLGCCGALANPEVARQGALALCGTLSRIELTC